MTWAYRQRLLRAAPARAAWRAWARGDIEEAERLAAYAAGPQRTYLLFLTSYVQGRYEQALAHHAALPAGRRAYPELDEPVVHALLHLGQPDEALAHARRQQGRRQLPPDLLLRAERPLGTSLEHTTALPFVDHPLAPYLPPREQAQRQRLRATRYPCGEPSPSSAGRPPQNTVEKPASTTRCSNSLGDNQ